MLLFSKMVDESQVSKLKIDKYLHYNIKIVFVWAMRSSKYIKTSQKTLYILVLESTQNQEDNQDGTKKWTKHITVQYSAAHPHTVAALIQDQPSVMAGIVKVALTMRHCVP